VAAAGQMAARRPALLVLIGLSIAALAVVIAGFFTVLITGENPQQLRDFLVGVYRYSVRVQAYTGLLTDQYPPGTACACRPTPACSPISTRPSACKPADTPAFE